MKFSLRSLFGIILVSALSINPARHLYESSFMTSFLRTFANISLWFSSWFLYFEPEYFLVNRYLNAEPYGLNPNFNGAGVIIGAIVSIVFWLLILLLSLYVILEIFGQKTPLRQSIDWWKYRYKLWRMKRNENKI